MEIVMHLRPNLLIETAELVCAYFNQISPKNLTAHGPYCIPAAEVERMMNLVCGDLDRDDARLRFYLQGLPADDPNAERRPIASVGGILVRSPLYGKAYALEEARTLMHEDILGDSNRIFNTFTGYALGVTTRVEYCSLTDELNKLNMSDILRLRLTEALSNYHYHVDQICDLLEPLARRLEPLLEPWVEKILPRIEQWRNALSTPEGVEAFCARLNTNLDGMERIFVGMSLFYPQTSQGHFSHVSKDLFCGLGLALPLNKGEQDELFDLDLAGLRLLSGRDRVEMLRSMAGKYMTQKELTRELGINSGTVFRDLSSMTMAHLLELVVEDGNRSYTTNLDYLERLTAKLMSYIRQGR